MPGIEAVNISIVSRARAIAPARTPSPVTPATRPAPSPATIVSTESLRATLAYLDAETSSNQRAMAVVDTADATLGAVNDLLVEAKTKALANANDAGLSAEEKTANEIEMRSALSAIDHLASNAKFAGVKLFDGDFKIAAGGASVDLEKVSTGTLNLEPIKAGTESDAATAIDAAIASVSIIRGKIGAFSKDTLQSQLEVATNSRIEVTSALVKQTQQAFELSKQVRSAMLAEPGANARVASHSSGNVLWLIRN